MSWNASSIDSKKKNFILLLIFLMTYSNKKIIYFRFIMNEGYFFYGFDVL